LAQVGIVVHDVEAAARHYAALLGQPVPEIGETLPGNEIAMTYRGAPSNARARLAFFQLGPVQLELIQPVGEDSAWAEGLQSAGEGVHHIAFWTDDMCAEKAVLEEHGAPMIHRADMGEGQYAYFDAREGFGTTIELLEGKRTNLG